MSQDKLEERPLQRNESQPEVIDQLFDLGTCHCMNAMPDRRSV